MRITSTTSVPVSAKEMTAAGPAEAITTPLPTNRPAPMTPPSAIISMWRRRSERRSPVGAAATVTAAAVAVTACSVAIGGWSASRALHVVAVLLQVADRLRQCLGAERVAELLRHHHLEHRRLAVALRPRGGAHRRLDVGEALDGEPLAAEGARHRRPAGVREVHALVTARIEVDVILFLRPPLLVIEHHHGDADALAGTGEQLVQADAPGAVADVGERRACRRGELRAADHRKGIAAVAEAHRGEHRARLVEAQV